MSCGARNLLTYENPIKLPSSEDLDISYNDVKLNLKLFNKYFEVNTLDEILSHRRKQFKIRKEQLQTRQETLHERENTLKERIISYEMYIKELAMKHDRSLRRIDDEKTFIKNKQTEINVLKQQIEQIQEEKIQLQKRIFKYQPHLTFLTQIVDQTDRYRSIDEMIEKFDMLYASYQDILSTIKNSNEELNNAQRQLLLTIEVKNTKISFMNDRIHELQQSLLQIHQRIENIQTEIRDYQQISTEHSTEIGSIKIAIESMFDLVKRYSRKKDFNSNDSLFIKLKQIDIFLSDLIYYVDYVNNKQKKIISKEHSINSEKIKINQVNILDDNNQWRGPCQLDGREIFEKTIHKHIRQSVFSYKVKGEDEKIYTIQMINSDNISQTRNSLTPKQSSISNKQRKSRTLKTSTTKLQSIDTQPRSSSTRTTFKYQNS